MHILYTQPHGCARLLAPCPTPSGRRGGRLPSTPRFDGRRRHAQGASLTLGVPRVPPPALSLPFPLARFLRDSPHVLPILAAGASTATVPASLPHRPPAAAVPKRAGAGRSSCTRRSPGRCLASCPSRRARFGRWCPSRSSSRSQASSQTHETSRALRSSTDSAGAKGRNETERRGQRGDSERTRREHERSRHVGCSFPESDARAGVSHLPPPLWPFSLPPWSMLELMPVIRRCSLDATDALSFSSYLASLLPHTLLLRSAGSPRPSRGYGVVCAWIGSAFRETHARPAGGNSTASTTRPSKTSSTAEASTPCLASRSSERHRRWASVHGCCLPDLNPTSSDSHSFFSLLEHGKRQKECPPRFRFRAS